MTDRDEYLSSTNIANCVFNAFICHTAIMLNSITIYAIRKTSSLPKHLKLLLLSLAVSDLGVGLIVQLITLLVIRLHPNGEYSPSFKNTYDVLVNLTTLPSFGSFFGVTAVTVDRFLAIHLHLRYQELVTHKRVVAVVISIWLLRQCKYFVDRPVPSFKGRKHCFVTINIVCLATTAVLYYKIYLAVRHHTNLIHALQVQQEAQNGEMANAARLRKSAIATFYVYLVLFTRNLF